MTNTRCWITMGEVVDDEHKVLDDKDEVSDNEREVLSMASSVFQSEEATMPAAAPNSILVRRSFPGFHCDQR